MAKTKHIWVFNPNKTFGITWFHSLDPSVSLMVMVVVVSKDGEGECEDLYGYPGISICY